MRRVLTGALTGALAGLLLGSVLVVAGTACAAADGTGADPGFGNPGGPGDSGGFGGFGGFGVLVVLAVLVSIGITIYKVVMAQELAKKSGMDPDQATAMTLLSDDGLEATYLASNLRPPPAPAADPPPTRTAAERLKELDALREQGLVTQAEYDERRAAIIGSI